MLNDLRSKIEDDMAIYASKYDLPKNLPLFIKKVLVNHPNSYIIPLYIKEKISDFYYLEKDYHYPVMDNFKVPPKDIDNIYEVSFHLDLFNEQIKKFCDIMLNNFKREDLVYFFHNINSLKTSILSTNNKENANVYITGIYDFTLNELKVPNLFSLSNIFHELFHMASSYYDKEENFVFSGFYEADLNTGFYMGESLNEGYTSLLASRYAGEAVDITSAYVKFIKWSILLEDIVTPNKMTSLYLNASLLGLIDELSKYDAKDNIIKFINYMDFYNRYKDNYKILPSLEKKLQYCEYFIEDFLIRNTLKKLKMAGTFNKEIIDEKINLLNKNVINSDLINHYLKEILGIDTLGYESYKRKRPKK